MISNKEKTNMIQKLFLFNVINNETDYKIKHENKQIYLNITNHKFCVFHRYSTQKNPGFVLISEDCCTVQDALESEKFQILKEEDFDKKYKAILRI